MRSGAFREAEARERLAGAETRTITVVSTALAKGMLTPSTTSSPRNASTPYGRFGSAENQKVIMLPLEASSLISSLAGIGEITRGDPSSAPAGRH